MSLFLEKRFIAVLGLGLLAATWKVTPIQAADRFYEDLLRRGVASAERGDSRRAVELLRMASFGLLEEPGVLAGCLVRLALVQADLDDIQAFRSTVDRLLEVEEGFSAYSDAKLSGPVRRRFEEQLRKRMKAEDLAYSSTFRDLGEPEELPVDRPLDEAEAPEIRENDESTQENPASVGMDPSGSATLLPVQVREALDAARDIQRDGTREDFSRELARLQLLAEQHPEVTELHQMAGVLSYRLGLWRESREFFERGGEIDSRESARLFYFAVVLYKTDALERAAEVLERGLPKLRRSPFVDDYVEKILGPGR